MSSQGNKVVVIGGGIQGCATAFFLAKRGQNVTVIEKDRIGRHASGVNAGGVRRLGRDILEIPLSLAAMDIWQNLYQEIGEYAEDFHPCFYLKVAVDVCHPAVTHRLFFFHGGLRVCLRAVINNHP